MPTAFIFGYFLFGRAPSYLRGRVNDNDRKRQLLSAPMRSSVAHTATIPHALRSSIPTLRPLTSLHSFAHSLILSVPQSPTRPLAFSRKGTQRFTQRTQRTQRFSQSLSLPLAHSPILSVSFSHNLTTHSPIQSFNHSLIQSFNHSIIHSFTH